MQSLLRLSPSGTLPATSLKRVRCLLNQLLNHRGAAPQVLLRSHSTASGDTINIGDDVLICFNGINRSGGEGKRQRWKKEDSEKSRASIYQSVIINTSKEMMCYSDFPIPDDFPNFMHNSKVLQYFRLYAEHFHLLKYIHFKTAVCKVEKRPDFTTTGQWTVITECNGEQKEHIFDAILVCTGHHTHPNLPLSSFPGIENFKGQYFHSRDYKTSDPFKDKRVIVIGVGNTGVDLVVELGAVAKQKGGVFLTRVFLSTRRGTWLLNRVCDHGLPLDIALFSRFNSIIQNTLPTLVNRYLENKVNSRVNHETYGLKPQHRFLSQHPTVSDNLPNCIIAGKVLVKSNVKRFTETDVIFEDGSVEKDIDVVIFATGYHFSFPFFDDSVLKVENNQVPLYNMIFPPHLENPTVACIGYIQPIGAIMPLSEMHARWATRVFKGLNKLPSKEKMMAEINKKSILLDEFQRRYVKSNRHTIQVDYVSHMDEIAEEIGCKPNLTQTFLTDPKLAWEILFGPCTPYQYRLSGPGKWNGARQAILSQMDRVIKPTKTRILQNQIVHMVLERRSPCRESVLTVDSIAIVLIMIKVAMGKKVAVIGAGASGLVAIKCCLDEQLEPTCFERSDDIGGLWRFKENPEDGRASIYKTVIINTSKEMMCYSDFPIPEDYPNYMHNSKIFKYFKLYAEHFQLTKHIQFKTTVCSIKKCADFAKTGQWEVVTEKDGKQETTIFDAVLVCSGHHTNAHLPLDSFPGIEKFKGQYLHSRDYKEAEAFKGKRVIIVGIGNSGGDIAVELSRTADQVFLSTRRGSWILNRVSDYGYPLDLLGLTRFLNSIKNVIPVSLLNKIGEAKVNKRFDHANYGLKPKHRMFSQHPMVNDDLPNRIIAGTVAIKSNVAKFTETDAIFDDGTVEKDIDAVIFATGYTFNFPFCEHLKVQNNKISLYKYVFLPELEKQTLAVIGLIQPLGAIMPISELQARLATRVFKGDQSLPSACDMKEDIQKKKEEMENRCDIILIGSYVHSQRHTIQVDYMDYMDELAEFLGVKPDMTKLFLTDPKLAWNVLFGPCTPYQYRLFGPGKWDKARKAILTQWDRALKPMKTRCIEPSNGNSVFNLMVLGIVVILVAWFFYF
ncbi:dimethylaniline monooxygenase [N-oxide-forming] 5-like [Pelobates cultripes]|uniref:Flavin-containing monooxygenase n=1 Tax=Pelobates cultripes TaxID=61616 RepID=A0AAD1SY65_PELCU|nr:dimethylaniline monooxygenase [N-oxide-forming] 5-like [Pelobates cultripes]